MAIDLSPYRLIVVFGGSFDPPHWGHVRLPMLAREAIGADVVVYVPAGRSPLKEGRRPPGAADRLRMLELALEGYDNAVIVPDEMEYRRGDEPSYTVDTLERLHRRIGSGAKMRLLIGADQLRQFDRWRNAERVIELAEPLVMLRPPDTREALLASLPAGYDAEIWNERIIELPLMSVSSTEVRRRVAAGEGIDDFVPAGVAHYIQDRGLYRVGD